MTEKITGIVLNIRKYNDRNCIVTLFTRSRGRVAFISPIGSGKASNSRKAKLQPLSVVSTDLNFKPSAELQRLGAVALEIVWSDLYFHPVKRVMTLFLSEFLDKLLIAAMPDPGLFDFLFDSLRFLDRSKQHAADFHIPFLVSLLSFTGIQPDVSGYRPGMVFDFNSGTFMWPEKSEGPSIEPSLSGNVKNIARINFSNIKRLRLTNANRRQILYGLLNYYSFHFPGLGSLKSPEVLREIFE